MGLINKRKIYIFHLRIVNRRIINTMELHKIGYLWHLKPPVDGHAFFISEGTARRYLREHRKRPESGNIGLTTVNFVELLSYDSNVQIQRLDDLRLDSTPQIIPPGLAHIGDVIVMYSIHGSDQFYFPTSRDSVIQTSLRSLEKTCTRLSIAPVFSFKEK